MRAVLGVHHTDVEPAALRWALGLPRQPALAVLHVPFRDLEVEVRVLGASHQIVATGEDFACSETGACGVDRAPPLPSSAFRQLVGGAASYRLTAEALTLRGDLDTFVARLDRSLGDRPDALVGIFPAPASALTAVLVESIDRGVAWRTWHAYPQVGTVVTTNATLLVG